MEKISLNRYTLQRGEPGGLRPVNAGFGARVDAMLFEIEENIPVAT